MYTKWNLAKNKMRAAGLKMSYTPEGEMTEGKLKSGVGSLVGGIAGGAAGLAAGGPAGAALGATAGSAAGAALDLWHAVHSHFGHLQLAQSHGQVLQVVELIGVLRSFSF